MARWANNGLMHCSKTIAEVLVFYPHWTYPRLREAAREPRQRPTDWCVIFCLSA